MGLGVEASLHINAGAARKGRLDTSGFAVSCARFAALSPESVRLSGAGLHGPLAGVCRWHLASQRQVLCRHALLGSGADSGGEGEAASQGPFPPRFRLMLMALYNVSINLNGLKYISESPGFIPLLWWLLSGEAGFSSWAPVGRGGGRSQTWGLIIPGCSHFFKKRRLQTTENSPVCCF